MLFAGAWKKSWKFMLSVLWLKSVWTWRSFPGSPESRTASCRPIRARLWASWAFLYMQSCIAEVVAGPRHRVGGRTDLVVVHLCHRRFLGAAAVVADGGNWVLLLSWCLLSCSGVGVLPKITLLETLGGRWGSEGTWVWLSCGCPWLLTVNRVPVCF